VIEDSSPTKLLYILNHYDPSASTHFSHVIPLLEEIASRGMPVRLLIEKAEVAPRTVLVDVVVAGDEKTHPFRRVIATARAVREAHDSGYNLAYVRISATGVIAAGLGRLVSRIKRKRAPIIYWQSGTTLTGERVRFLPKSLAPRWAGGSPSKIAAWQFMDYFATGPGAMIDYYREYGDVPARKLVLLYNDVDCSRYAFSTGDQVSAKAWLCEVLGIDSDKRIILHNHRFSPVRRSSLYFPNLMLRLQEMDLLEGCHFVLVGGGPDKSEIEERVLKAGLGASVTFMGSMPNRELDRVYAASDLFLQASYAEGFPRVLLEAMASGLPMVSTDAGGSGDLVGPLQAQHVHRLDDLAGMARSLAELVSEPEKAAEVGQENKEWVRRYDLRTVASMYIRALGDLVED
jgi:glycosyltransferase involved in cell wall biosynthesis